MATGRVEIELARLLDGGLAWLIVAAATLWPKQPIGELAQLYSLDFALRPLALVDSLAQLGAAAALGWLGAGLSLRQHLGNH